MKGKKYRLNIDKLILCYIAETEIVNDLESIKKRDFDGFRLTQIPNETPNETHLQIHILDKKNNEYKEFGEVKIGNKFERKDETQRFVWLMINNKVFYGYTEEYNELNYIYNIAKCLRLELKNIKELHIALNSNVNWFWKIKKAIGNLSLIPIILGKKYKEKKEIIDKVMYIHTRDRERIRTNTIVIKNADKDMEMCVYNKSEEIEKSRKEYIAKDFGGKATIFRNEVRLKKTALKDYLKIKDISWRDLYDRLCDINLLYDIFQFYENRIIRFIDEKRNIISVLQL